MMNNTFLRTLMVGLLLLSGSVGAWAEDYVFTYNYSGTYYIFGQSTSVSTDFIPNNCVYTGTSGGTFQNGNGYYIVYANQSVAFNTSSGSDLTISNNHLYYDSSYYLRYSNSGKSWQFRNNYNVEANVYVVTTSSHINDFTISGDAVISTTGTNSSYAHTNANYYDIYSFDSRTYYSTDPSAAASTTTPTSALPTLTTGYTWSLSSNSYATVNAATGAITLNSLPGNDTNVTLTCSITRNGVTKTVTKTITLEAPKVDPTDISITSGNTMTAYVGNTSNITYSLTPSPCYDNVTFTSNATSVATVDANGVVTGVSVGTATITVSALKIDGTTTSALTKTVTVTVKEKVATPVITFTPDVNDNTKATATITCTTPGTTIYYKVNSGDYAEFSSDINVNENDVVSAYAVKTSNPDNLWDQSDETTNTYVSCTTDAPTITYSASGSSATVTITAETGATIYYTTNGDAPTTSSTSGTTTVTINNVSGGTNVKAFAKNSTCQASAIVEKEIITSGTSGDVVTLYDYEDHNWTYYSGVDASVDAGNYNTSYLGRLYSPNPRNVKITYKANGGAVSISESETEFVYYKTLEQGATTGQYPYTVISNPFSKRPSGKGFGGWKIKEGAQYINGYNDEDVLPLDADIVFTNLPYPSVNCTSAEIEFEATWVNYNNRTYASDNTFTYNVTGGTYETNFLVLNRNVTGTITVSSPCTIMMVEPDGSTDYRNNYTFTGNITPNNNGVTKIEFTKWNSTNTLNCNNHNVTVGRGMTTTSQCASYVTGVTGSTSTYNRTTYSSSLDYHLKIESGTFTDVSFLAGTEGTAGYVTCNGTSNQVKGTLGNDYDRAKGDNTKLTVSDELFLGYRPTYANGNQNNANFTCWVKSGNLCSGTNVTNTTFNYQGSPNGGYYGDASQLFYCSVGGAQTYIGKRTVYVEGGILSGIAGGIDSNNGANNESFIVRMTGGQVRGVVYGSGAFAASSGIRRFIVTGGTINGWVAAGCNGTDPSQSGGTLPSDTYVYIGGTAHIGNATDLTLNTSSDGNVFGAGSGNSAQATTGQVNNSNVVVADDAYVKNNVYGGGNYGYSNATATVYVTGGEVAGSVFGGSNQKQGVTVNLNMTGGQVDKGVYGGSNVTGTISGSVTMNINGGQVGTPSSPANIHGGGYGAETRVTQNVEVTLGKTGQTEGGVTVYGDVYGGSALGYVNGTAANTTYHTNVTLNKGIINGSLYGGGLGDASTAANVYGPVAVKVYGGSVKKTDSNGANGSGGVYGANNINGAPQRSVTVDIYGTDPAPSADEYALYAVYGGGNAADYTYGNGYPTVTVHNCDNSIEYVYGGGNAAAVAATDVTIYGGNKIGNVFGGGNGTVNAANVTGNTNVKIYGGTILKVFGGSNSQGTIGGTINVNAESQAEGSGTACPMLVDELYGGGNLAASNVGNITIGCMNDGDMINYVYGGSNNAAITGDISLTMTGGRIENLFGGNNTGSTISGTISVNVNWSGSCPNSYLGNVFGGGNHAAYDKTPAVTITNGTVTHNVYGGGNEAGVAGGNVQMAGGTVLGGIYGGCNTSGTVTGDIAVNVTGGTVGSTTTKANVFGGGYGSATATDGNVDVNINGSSVVIYGDVYGGSALGNVNSDTNDYTHVTLTAGTIHGDAYGGGLGDDSNAALVNGNVTVTQNGVAFVTNTTQDDKGNTVVTAGRIFGCNNLNGSPQGSVLVLVNKTSDTPTEGTYDMNAVYGGGNLAPYNPATIPAAGQFTSYTKKGGGTGTHDATGKPIQVVINGCDNVSVEYVYGGGNAAPTPCTDVLVLGAFELGYVFGGGNGKDRYTRDGGTAWNANPGADVGLINGATYGSGDANTSLYGGKIHEAYGASNQKGTIKGNINLDVKEGEVTCNLEVGKIVGAGKNADVDGDINLVMGCMPADKKTNLVFGGADNANVDGNVELTITSGTFGQVFGGNNLGGIIKGHIKVNIEETGCNPIRIDELYLGGNEAAYSIFGYYEDGTLDDGRTKYSPRTSADDSHTAVTGIHNAPYDQPVLNVISCTSIGKVFGGGLGTGAVMYADPTVNINMVQGEYYTQLPVNENNPDKLGAVENVYGGGNEAAVNGSTKVNIGTEIGNPIAMESSTATPNVLGAYVTGTVYGAGKGVATDSAAAIVTGNTQINMAGGHVSRSIYGGGELGSVGTFTETYAAQELHPYHAAGEPKACKAGTGLTEVKISGGQVGLVRQLMPDPANPTYDDDYGYVFCAGKGVADSVTYNKAHLLAVSGSSNLEISGTALIAASVYGGSENGQVLGDTHVKIMGGQIGTGHYEDGSNVDHWDAAYTDAQWTAVINAIKSGVEGDINTAVAPFHECDAWLFGPEGNRHVYDYFAGEAGAPEGGAKPGSDGHSYYGHVFGGGSGYYPFAPGQWRRTAGRVNGNTLVEITGGHVLTNVYGGNEITDVLGHSKVEMSGGTVGVPRTIAGIQARPVNSYIFGAGMGDPRTFFNGWSNVGSAEVIVHGDAVVFGSVFGGGEDGHVLGDVSTTIKGDALIGTFGSSGVDGNIFGSGRGFSALALTAGTVCGNVTVNIAERAKILGSIFGGGRMAAVGTYLAAEGTDNYGKLQPGNTHGNVTINITGGTIGNQSQMSTSQYSIGDVFGGSKGTLMSDWAKTQMLGLVKNTTVNISGSNTRIYGSVYGGGELASVGSYNYATATQAQNYNTNHASENMYEGDVYELREAGSGLAKILITGGIIGQNSLSDTKGSVFGGCLGKAGTAYSGYSFVNNSDVTLNGGTVYGCIFGGGENGHVFSDTDVKILSGTVGLPLDKDNVADANLVDNMIYRGNVYGGGRGVDTYESNNNGQSTYHYSITAGKVAGNTNVTVEGGTICRNVYGGGSLASVGVREEVADSTLISATNPFPFATGLAKVTIKGGTIGTDGGASANNYNTLIPDRENRRENGFVFGSGRGMAAGAQDSLIIVQLAYTKNTLVSIEGTGNVTGSVFGGGENGHVQNNTKVYVKENSFVGTELTEAEHDIDDNGRGRLLYRGNVYGGGRGIDKAGDGNYYSLTAGRVYGDTFVEVSGGTIYHDVFGGGSLASVGNETITNGEVSYGDESGEAEVHIKGGVIGYSSNTSKQGFNCGFVYGGCRGLSAQSSDRIVKMAYVHDTKVYIEPGADVKGSVFGGGANGHVKNDTYVEISGGSIGTALLEDEVGFDDHGVAVKPVFRGNVYAGGRGVDQYYTAGTSTSEAKYSLSAGAVYGNAELKMTGGHVWHNVYGSGAMASVGTVKAKAAGQHVHDEVVDGSGTVVDNVIYNPDESDINYLTGVFKEGTGTVTVTITGGTVGDTTPGHEGRNNGRVYGAGRGVSADRSDYVASMEYVNKTFVTIGTEGQTTYADNDPDKLAYPYIYGAVFGGGENGHVKTDTDVKIHSGIIGFPLVEGTNGMYKTGADGSSKNPYRGNVFGGGRGVDPVHHQTGEQRSSSAGRVYGHTNVTMTGGVVRRAIYGGGLLASVGVYRLLVDDMHIIDMIEDEVDGGDATVNISGGYIGNVNPDGTALSGTGYLVPGDNNGHVFGSSCGMVADDYVEGGQQVDVQYRQMGYAHSTHVNISGGHLFGSVFGSGENGHVWENAIVNISGGEIGYQTNSNTFIYAGNVYGSGRGVDHPHEKISETAGKVRGNTTVNVTGGIVWRDVYGGGSLASVGEADEAAADSKKKVTDDPLTNNPFPYSTGLTRVVIDGTSAVHGSVYGSGRGVASTNELYKQAAYVKNTLVTVKGTSHVFQNVFGGGNAGHVRKNTDVTIDGSATVDGNVYGGGTGSIESPTAGLVNHDVTVNIKDGLIRKDVYGGGAIANTNVHDVRNTAATDCRESSRVNAKTLVNLTGGIILGDAYGGGQGVIPASGATAAEIANAAALVQGDVTVTLNGTAFYPTTNNGVATSGRVFGCNNLNGSPQGTVLVHVLQTKGVTKSGDTYTVNTTKPILDTGTYEVEAVYGGGNLAAYEPWDATATGQYSTDVVAASNPLQVLIEGCDLTSIDYVYGGGNAASTPSTQVIVRGAYELGTVFGGGNGKDALPNGEPNPGAHVGYKADGTTTYGAGDANVYLYGGYIHNAFGASNTKGNIAGKAEVHINEAKDGSGKAICPLILDEVYGGGNEAYMAGGTDIDMGCITYLKAIYGGAKNANVGGDIVLTITSGHFDRVFGGNNIGGVISGSITVNIEETGCNPITIGELYGCGNQARYTTPGDKHPTINVRSFTSIGRIFGGGLGETAVVTGNPTVNINEIVGNGANNMDWTYHQTTKTEGGETVPDAGKTINFSDGTSVTMPTHAKGKIGAIGTVYGGGNAAPVVGGTNVFIGTKASVEYNSVPGHSARIEGVDIRDNVFGAGLGTTAKVTGDTNVVVGQ